MHEDDHLLVTEAKENLKAYEALYRKYYEDVFNFFWYRVGHNKVIAEDLMQETFLRAFKHLPKFRRRGYSYLTYLLTIARNLLTDHFRKQKDQLTLDEIGPIPDEAGQNLDTHIDSKRVWERLQTQLSESERGAMLLFYRTGHSIKEIAQITGKSENAVKILLSRARKKLKADPHLQLIAGFSDIQRQYKKPKFLKK